MEENRGGGIVSGLDGSSSSSEIWKLEILSSMYQPQKRKDKQFIPLNASWNLALNFESG